MGLFKIVLRLYINSKLLTLSVETKVSVRKFSINICHVQLNFSLLYEQQLDFIASGSSSYDQKCSICSFQSNLGMASIGRPKD